MDYIFEAIGNWFSFAVSQLAMIQVRDVFDILVLSVFLFLILRFAWDRRAGKLLIVLYHVDPQGNVQFRPRRAAVQGPAAPTNKWMYK